MILIDSALQQRQAEGRPIRVGMVGAGFIGRGVALQLLQVVPGMELAAIANRTVEKAGRAFREAGAERVRRVETAVQLDDALARGVPAVTDDPMLLCWAEGIDCIVDATGVVEFGAHVAMEAIAHGKHLVLLNAELDATVGPILKTYADRAGVVVTGADGDQPAVIMNLYRFVKGIGVRPVLCGNIKGLQDRYRNPTTQEGFARQWGQTPTMVTSFADGTKISFEQALVANATGMGVAVRGMVGPTVPAGTLVDQVMELYPLEAMLEGPGIVDYVVGAHPAPGVFVIGTHDHPQQQHYLRYSKLGDGPLYCFYTPYHLMHFEVHNSVARAVLFGDAAIAPLGGPVVDVVATAKVGLRAGQTLDGPGGYHTYGLCENADAARAERLLPMGLAEGCVLKRDVPADQALTYDDVEIPGCRLVDRLRAEQDALFSPAVAQPAVGAVPVG